MARKRAAKVATEMPSVESPATNGTRAISKADAVRAAVAEGNDTPEAGTAFILKKFGIEVTKPQWSSYRSQDKARQRKKAGGTTAKPGRAPRTEAAPIPATLPPSGMNGPAGLATSVEAIKTLVDTLGYDQVVSIARLFAK